MTAIIETHKLHCSKGVGRVEDCHICSFEYEEVPDVPETVMIGDRQVPTDLCYTIQCPDVLIRVKQMGKKTSVRVEPVLKVDDDDLFIEARFNTIPIKEALEKVIIKIKLSYDALAGKPDKESEKLKKQVSDNNWDKYPEGMGK